MRRVCTCLLLLTWACKFTKDGIKCFEAESFKLNNHASSGQRLPPKAVSQDPHLAVLAVHVVLACGLSALAFELLLHSHTDASLLQAGAAKWNN
eukprot:1156479-Pelagomonas_calceolata.AAC.6